MSNLTRSETVADSDIEQSALSCYKFLVGISTMLNFPHLRLDDALRTFAIQLHEYTPVYFPLGSSRAGCSRVTKPHDVRYHCFIVPLDKTWKVATVSLAVCAIHNLIMNTYSDSDFLIPVGIRGSWPSEVK